MAYQDNKRKIGKFDFWCRMCVYIQKQAILAQQCHA